MNGFSSADPSHSASHAAFAGCGERLRSARVAAGLSVEDVAARLRMPERVVRSLEAEDWSRLGAPVFVRGQVRSYSRLLGLTTAPMMAAIDVGPIEPTRLVSRTHTPKLQWWAEQVGRRLVYVVLTLSLAIPAWVATQQHLGTSSANVAPLDAPDPAQGNETVPPRTMVASLAPVPTMAPAANAPAVPELVLRTQAEAWVDVSGEGGASLERGLVAAGSERRYPLAQVRSLKIGNAAAVTLESNGRPVAFTPRAGVVRFAVSSDGALVASE